eukprot:gene52985-16176_t
MGDRVQLHGCNATVANNDWTIYLPGTRNVDESACRSHPTVMEHRCAAPPPPAPARSYDVLGSIDVGTLETSIFLWDGGHSYARIRELKTGRIVANVSETIGYSFVSAFPDAEKGKMWLVGNGEDRCHKQCGDG